MFVLRDISKVFLFFHKVQFTLSGFFFLLETFTFLLFLIFVVEKTDTP